METRLFIIYSWTCLDELILKDRAWRWRGTDWFDVTTLSLPIRVAVSFFRGRASMIIGTLISDPDYDFVATRRRKPAETKTKNFEVSTSQGFNSNTRGDEMIIIFL